MTESLLLLDKQKIKKNLTDKSIEIDILEKTHSTNDYLKSFLSDKKSRICLAEQQTHGKGRLGRTWYSPFGQNIYFSCQYFFHHDVSALAGLSLVVSLAVAKALSLYDLPQPILVKWPNDILYDHKKLSGNLIEVQAEAHHHCSAIIGIGVNVNMLFNETHDINQPWISLREITHGYVDRNALTATIINQLFLYLKKFAAQGLSAFNKEWESRDYLANNDVTLKHVNTKISGRVKGINDQGHLLIKRENGTLQAFSSGDTTLLKK